MIKESCLRLTVDKRLRCYAPPPKLPSATSFIRKTISKMPSETEDVRQDELSHS